jgi:Ca2+-binding RTX toxin-like protein
MHLAVENLEARLLFALNPTPREQELLEMLNRMRTHPQAEYKILTQTKNQDVLDALNFFNVDLKVLAQQFAALVPAQPLAWNSALRDAGILHSKAMLAADMQTHQAPGELDLAKRIKAAGYTDMSVAGENVFAFANSMFHAHASFAIDWGNDAHGIQSPPGHRDNMMDADYREIGMGIIDATKGKDVGPILVSQEFGNRFHFGNSFFLGVIYSDTNHDGQYNAGEGAGGATINFTGKAGTFSTTSMSAGGYQLQIPAGTYTVSATAKALGGTVYYHNLNIGSQNAKQDFLAGNWPLAHYSKGRLTIEGTAGNDVFSVTESAGQIHVKRNKQTESFDAAKISRIDLFGANGNDTIDFSTVSIPTYIDAGKGNDSVICGGGSDTVTGGAGNDTVFGGNGNDQLHGSIGNDWLYGQAGDDKLFGEEGDDSLNGGAGADVLDGGDGHDLAEKDSLDTLLHVEAVLT